MTLAPPAPSGELSPKKLLVLAVPTLLLGVLVACLLWVLEYVAGELQHGLWDALPKSLGVDPDGWWIITTLTLTGLAIGLCLQWIPGHGGPDSATTELVGQPLPLAQLPGIAIVTVLALGGGVSLGPENPIIAINVAIVAFLLAKALPQVPSSLAVLIAGAGTVGALFGTPVAAALVFTEIVSAVATKTPLWNKLFLPLVAAGAGTVTMHYLGGQRLGFDLPAYGTPKAIDLATGSLVACVAVLAGLVMLYLFPLLWRAFHALPNKVLPPLIGGLLLGVLGYIGGPITMFKGLEQVGELLHDPGGYSSAALVAIIVIKALALVIAASALFRGGRIFPATFIGVAIGMVGHVLIPGLPLGLAVACGVLGILLVVSRDGWLSLFIAIAIPADITLLPIMCVIVLPAWLLVSGRPGFQIIPPKPDAATAS